MYRGRIIVCLGALNWLVAGCGGGSSAPSGGGLSGTITGATFTIPAGQTMTVTGPLVIHTTKSLDIEGTLQIPPGVDVALISDGPNKMNGSIVSTAPSASKTFREGADNGPSNILWCGGSGSEITPLSYTAPQNSNVLICGQYGSITRIVAGNGLDSSDKTKPGGDGGSIEIGTPNAIAFANSKGSKNATIPSNLTIGSLQAGTGGNGWSDKTGVATTGLITATGTVGGAGGNVYVVSQTSIDQHGDWVAGSGGFGGDCDIEKPGAATTPKSKGLSLALNSGGGGNGGKISVSPGVSESAGTKQLFGAPGASGSTIGIAQDGGPNGGAGGDISVNLGPTGANFGTYRNAPETVQFSVTCGNGAAANDASTIGGGGGRLSIAVPGLVPANAATIKFSGGSGGNGFGGCSVNKNLAGTNGGPGGTINATPLCFQLFSQPTLGVNAFSGGSGGSGTPPGAGGAAGILTLTTARAFGAAGTQGRSCAGGAVLYKTQTLSVPTDFIFDSLAANGSIWCSNLTSTKIAKITVANWNVQVFTTRAKPGHMAPNSAGDLYAAEPGGSPCNLDLINGNTGDDQVILNGKFASLGSSLAMVSAGGQLYFEQEGPLLSGGQGEGIFAYPGPTPYGFDVGVEEFFFDTYSMVFDPVRNRIYVNEIYGSNGTIAVIDLASKKVLKVIPIARSSGIAVDTQKGTIFASQRDNNQMAIIDPNTFAVTMVNTLQSPSGIAVDSQRRRVYVGDSFADGTVGHGHVSEFDADKFTLIGSVDLGAHFPNTLVMDVPGDRIYTGNLLDGTISVLNGN